MSDPRRRRIVIGIIATAVVGAIIGLAIWDAARGGEEQTACGAAIEEMHSDYENGRTVEDRFVRVTLLADLPSNDADGIAYVTTHARPLIDQLVGDAAISIKFIAHLGEGVLKTSECLNGITVSALHQNDRRRNGNLLELTEAILEQMETDIRSWPVATTGSVMPLLREIETGTAIGADGGQSAEHWIVVLSDLVANDGSCLDGTPEGLQWAEGDPAPYADADLAQRIVARCEAEGLLPQVGPGEQWVFLGAGRSNRSAQFGVFADALAVHLCDALGSGCTAAIREAGTSSDQGG